MSTSYTWELVAVPDSGSLPNPGTYVPSLPTRRKQGLFQRGIKFANVPEGRPENVVHGGPRVWHVNSVQIFQHAPASVLEHTGMYSGVIKNRLRDYRDFPVPASVNPVERRSVDQFGNPVLEFTGKF